MSLCPLCRHEEKSGEQTANPALEWPSSRAFSSKRRLRLWTSEAISRGAKDSIVFMTLIGSATFIKYYDAHPSRALNWALLDEGKDLGKERASILPTCICKLAKIARAAAEQSKTLEKITARIASLLDTLHITRLLEDPPPQLFLVACLFFVFGLAALQHSHKADIYLNRILVLGLMIGCVAAFQTADFLMALKSYLAWSAILALFLSILIHWAMRVWQGPQTLDDGPGKGIQHHHTSCDRRKREGDVIQNASQR